MKPRRRFLWIPTSSEPAFIFNILDQSSTPVNNLPASTSNITGAINPLTNGALVLNKGGQAYVIDPTVPTVICNTQPCSATFNTGTTPVDVAIDPVDQHRRDRESRWYAKPLFAWRLDLQSP